MQGISAGFWYDNLNDFKTVVARSSLGLVRSWRDTIASELEDEEAKKKFKPLEHKLVKFLLSDFVEAIDELEARKAELESQIKAANPKDAQSEEGAADDTDSDEEAAVDEEQLRVWKKDLSAVRKALKAKMESFADHLNETVDELGADAAADLLLTILHNDMQAIVERYIAAQRKRIVAAFENWWDKYRVTLTEIEDKRDAAAKALHGFLKELRYD